MVFQQAHLLFYAMMEELIECDQLNLFGKILLWLEIFYGYIFMKAKVLLYDYIVICACDFFFNNVINFF